MQRQLSYSTAQLSCPFLEARGNLQDASTTLSAHSRVWLWDVERLYRMSWLELIAAIPGKGLTKGLLLRRMVECVTVTREDECLTSNKTISFFQTCNDRARRYAQRSYLCTSKHAAWEKVNSELYSQSGNNWWTVIDAIGFKLSGSFVRDIGWLISRGLHRSYRKVS